MNDTFISYVISQAWMKFEKKNGVILKTEHRSMCKKTRSAVGGDGRLRPGRAPGGGKGSKGYLSKGVRGKLVREGKRG